MWLRLARPRKDQGFSTYVEMAQVYGQHLRKTSFQHLAFIFYQYYNITAHKEISPLEVVVHDEVYHICKMYLQKSP